MACVVVAAALAIGALVSAIVMSIAATNASAERSLRAREGVAAQAEVVSFEVRRGKNARRIVSYRFETDGRSYTGRTRLRTSDRREFASGMLVPVMYVQSDPSINWMSGYEADDGFPLWAIPLVSASLLAGAFGTAWGLRRQWRLLSEGRVALARVTGHKKVHRDKGTVFRVTYEYEDLNGGKHVARHDAGKTPPPIGTVVPLVYHRDNPKWSAAYPLQLVRTVRQPSAPHAVSHLTSRRMQR
jgi:hypothetical protein